MTRPKLKLAYERPSERIYGSPQFINRGRNTKLDSPTRFEPTVKGENDVVI